MCLQEKLSAMFPPEDIEWRVQQAGISGENPWVMAVPYITARAVQQRLDDAVGVFGWEVEYRDIRSGNEIIGVECGITLYLEGRSFTKWDAAEFGTRRNIDAVKTARSTSMKRAAVQWGIGRYLYQMETTFAESRKANGYKDKRYGNIHVHREKGKPDRYIDWREPTLPAWAIPQRDYEEFLSAMLGANTMDELSRAFSEATKAAKASGDRELLQKVIKTKDEKKQQLIDYAAEHEQTVLSDIEAKLQESIAVLPEMPSKATLDNAYRLAVDLATEKAEEFGVSPASLIQHIGDVYRDAKSKLEGTDHETAHHT
ncbi:Rad52/Rad22 family DNA repair protein [Parasalinivibrio latis]|uniref:Rad52/Rad22 family DNA repair protein n=1 Tax=Parasalinivibrio latis TaxID=2952610 RepID=UPI0030DF97DD